ncbi:ZZ-type domain-containing protein [Caenorhabditis elegans]|uniref:ZZ-type domain-containing protein n=1 Tax=Caenorhabditis elegans TaxID=6239 RepID=Q9XXG8_CAEEL|nr:ZZ-type domain-containing protein [Caenorhabditis elegans]CAA19481.1 ZZ-type domain-containing protein [Caenorhabditis elegans]|eukprot:NP_507173.1 SeQueSTosome related [Caenorhabditis elegans]
MTSHGPHSVEELKYVPAEYHDHVVTSTIHQSEMHSGYHRDVYVTFNLSTCNKIIRMDLHQDEAFDQLHRKAREMISASQFKMFDGSHAHATPEITNSSQVMSLVKISPIYRFPYLIINLEPCHSHIHPTHPIVRCDSCYTTITGHRFKCTICTDYDICSSCEARNAHAQHTMLRIAA